MPRLALPLLAALALLCLLGACNSEQRNAAFCCLTAADCAPFGITGETLLCTEGLQCVQNTCVAQSCETSGCTATAPVCDTATDQCTGCTESSQCTGADVCDQSSGACVGCVSSDDCASATPVCGADQTCSKCTRDSDCASNACADDGTCVAEENVVYIAPDGLDTGTCMRDRPCKLLNYAVLHTGRARSHVVIANGVYVYPGPSSASAPSGAELWIHGNGATLTAVAAEDGFLRARAKTTMRDLILENSTASVLSMEAGSVLERATVRGKAGIGIFGDGTVRDVRIAVTNTALSSSTGSATIDRVTIEGGQRGIFGLDGAYLTVRNTLIHGTTVLPIEMVGAFGQFDFVTIANTGAAATVATAMSCDRSGVVLRNSIAWTPGATSIPAIAGACTVSDSVVGPVAFDGAINVDPLFVGANDYHLQLASPARDRVDAGPAVDIEGDVRPQGPRFDLGADETH